IRRNLWSGLVFGAIAVALAIGLFQHRDALAFSNGAGAFFTALGRALAAPPASWALFPFHLVVAPTFAQTTPAWLRAIGPAGLLLAFPAWWVLRTDSAFEDAAIVASAERARRVEAMRSRRSLAVAPPPRSVTSTHALAAVGHPALAIVWKNLLCLRRTAQ